MEILEMIVETNLLTCWAGCIKLLITFDIFVFPDSISKEINCTEHEYMNMSPSLIELATPLP